MGIPKFILISLLGLIIVFLVTVNLTPGHFQTSPGCGCGDCGYHTQKDFDNFNKNICWAIGVCNTSYTRILKCAVLNSTSVLDFNK
jgi:hypothetical protein